MFKIGIAETFYGYQRRFFMSIQIAIVMFLSVACISVYLFQMKEYTPFKKFIGGKGIYTFVNGNLDELVSEMKSIDSVLYTKGDTIEDTTNKLYFSTYAYNECAIKYEPIMAEGKWITEKESEGDLIEAVITSNKIGIKTGDVLEGMSLVKNKLVRVKIIGVVAEGAPVYNVTTVTKDDNIYNWYMPLDYTEKIGMDPYLFISQKDMDKWGIGDRVSRVFIKFDDDITEEKLAYNLSVLKNTGHIVYGEFETLRSNTKAIIKGKVMALFPIFLCALVLVTFGTIALSLLETVTDINRYSVMYLTGMKWSGCIKICSIRAFFELVAAFALMWIAKGVMNLIYGRETLIFIWNIKTVATVFAISLYFYLIAVIPPAIMLRFNSPVALLRRTRV